MREQIRLWFYSQLFMSVALTGRAPYRKVLGYEKMLDENGREMHGSWGNMITRRRGVRAHGRRRHALAVLPAAAEPEPALRLRPGYEIQRKLLTLWNSASFFVQYANIAGFTPTYADLDDAGAGGRTRSTGGCAPAPPARRRGDRRRTSGT